MLADVFGDYMFISVDLVAAVVLRGDRFELVGVDGGDIWYFILGTQLEHSSDRVFPLEILFDGVDRTFSVAVCDMFDVSGMIIGGSASRLESDSYLLVLRSAVERYLLSLSG